MPAAISSSMARADSEAFADGPARNPLHRGGLLLHFRRSSGPIWCPDWRLAKIFSPRHTETAGTALDPTWPPRVFNPLSSTGFSGPDPEDGLLRCLAGGKSPARTGESHKESSVENDRKSTCRLDRIRDRSFGENRGGWTHVRHVPGVAWRGGPGAVGPGRAIRRRTPGSRPPTSCAVHGRPWPKMISPRPIR